jgi:tellurite resistance protein
MGSSKKATDDVLLAQAMLLMAAADGYVDEAEISTVAAFANTLPEFKEGDFAQAITEAQKLMRKYPKVQDSVAALAELSTQRLKTKAFLLAADIALASGDVDEEEDALLESMQRVLGVDDATAQNIINVLSLKYAT